jgi:hypothetical protein
MSDTTAAPEATWRDLTDMLTDPQIEELEEWSTRLDSRGPEELRLGLLRLAANLAYENVLAARYADVVEPPDAVRVDKWRDIDDLHDGGSGTGPFRRFTSSATWTVGADGQEPGYQVDINGFQFPDGSTRRWVTSRRDDDGSDDACITPTPRQSRQLGHAFIAAGDWAETLDDGGRCL